VGAASGKLDALAFIVGMLLGIWGFAELYGALYGFVRSGEMGTLTLPDLLRLSPWIVALIVVATAWGLFRLATFLENRYGGAKANR
jgi:uncharacterized protein